MKKLFISQPMRSKTPEEILLVRKALIEDAHDILGEPIDTIQSYFELESGLEPASALEALGRSLTYLALADYAIFADGWQDARGCQVEHLCCEKYNIPILKD